MPEPAAAATPDFSHLARRPSERLAVVQYVIQTANLQETDYLEWKTAYDLSKNSGAAATAKHLIGFANRDFPQAERHADGHAYLLLGVEPANLLGVPRWDSADIENWLVRFVGRDLRYDIHYVALDDKQVLFLTVDPPRDGDPIYCLQQASGEPGTGRMLPEGAVYVRHGGQTDVGDASDISRLTARACGVPSTLDLSVEFDTSKLRVIGERVVSDAARDAFVESERRRLYGSLPSRDASWGLGSVGETRSRQEFGLEVEAYLEAVAFHWHTVVVVDHIAHERSLLTTVIANHTDQNFEDVVLELTLPFDSRRVYARPGHAASRLSPPDAPSKWGTSLYSLVHPTVPRLGTPPPEPEIEAQGKGMTFVRFPPLHVRPHTPHRLPPLLLALPPDLAETTQTVRWRVTARNTPGQLEGRIDLLIPDQESEELPEAPD